MSKSNWKRSIALKKAINHQSLVSEFVQNPDPFT